MSLARTPLAGRLGHARPPPGQSNRLSLFEVSTPRPRLCRNGVSIEQHAPSASHHPDRKGKRVLLPRSRHRKQQPARHQRQNATASVAQPHCGSPRSTRHAYRRQTGFCLCAVFCARFGGGGPYPNELRLPQLARAAPDRRYVDRATRPWGCSSVAASLSDSMAILSHDQAVFTSSASLSATISSVSTSVLRPLRDASSGLTIRKAS